jgi:hypothetical protein
VTLKENLALLESLLPQLKSERNDGPLENDLCEAIDDWCHLGRRAVENDTRVNYPARAGGERMLLKKLREFYSGKRAQDLAQHLPLLDTAEEMIQQIASISTPLGGHLEVLRAIGEHFAFLQDEYGFRITGEEPTGVKMSSGAVSVDVHWATQSFLSFSISDQDGNSFWIEDFLYLYRDDRYRTVPQALELATENDVNSWFQWLSEILRNYGNDALANRPGTFDQLAKAQLERDAEFVAMMEERNQKQNECNGAASGTT